MMNLVSDIGLREWRFSHFCPGRTAPFEPLWPGATNASACSCGQRVGSCSAGCVSRCRYQRGRIGAPDGLGTAFRERLIFRDYATRGEPECHFRRQRISHARRALPDGLLTTLFFLAVFLVIGRGWIVLITR